ncbi:MAG: stage II sporulation protein M [Armatimonadota bacterium]
MRPAPQTAQTQRGVDPPEAAQPRRRWARLAELIAEADLRGLRVLDAAELDEFARLYRQAVADLASARSRGRDERTVSYLNDLVGRAAGLIYGGRARRRIHPLRFFLGDIPRTFRGTWRFTAAAFLASVLPALVVYLASVVNPAWADALFMEGMTELVQDFLSRDVPPGQYFGDSQSLIGADNLSGHILVNNIKVSLGAFALGITAGLGTLYLMIFNGLMLGAFMGVFAHHGRLMDGIGIIAPHGFLELSAIFMCGGAGFLMGWALIDPGDRLRLEALGEAARTAVVLLGGALAMIGVAAVIEGFVSPQTTGMLAANESRIMVGLVVWLVACAWLLAGDRLVARHADSPDEDAAQSSPARLTVR